MVKKKSIERTVFPKMFSSVYVISVLYICKIVSPELGSVRFRPLVSHTLLMAYLITCGVGVNLNRHMGQLIQINCFIICTTRLVSTYCSFRPFENRCQTLIIRPS